MLEIGKAKDDLVLVLQEQCKDLWKKGEDTEFLRNIASDIIAQQLKVKTAGNEQKRMEYITNIEHLLTQLEGRIAGKKNDLIAKGDWILSKLINVALKVAISSIL